MIHCGDCLSIMAGMEPASVDLVFGSPPYVDCRTYGIGFALKGQDWVDWMVERVVASLRVCRGLVAFVVEGKTKQFRYDCTPALLMADLHRRGVHLRKPPAFQRVGIPGSGGPDWLRNDWEWIICCTNGGKLPWSDNTAMGHPPKWAPGGAMSNRHADGQRSNASDGPKAKARRSSRNQWGGTGRSTGNRTQNGKRDTNGRPSHNYTPSQTQREAGEDGNGSYDPPALANPGNIIECIVGGGVMGSKLAHENEAPFPETLAEFFVRSFCPPGGTVLDPFCGSGTTLAVASKWGRQGIGIDVRESQVELSRRRVAEASRPLLTE